MFCICSENDEIEFIMNAASVKTSLPLTALHDVQKCVDLVCERLIAKNFMKGLKLWCLP
jgi:hypothetical protein